MKKIMLILIILASLIPGIIAVVQYLENEDQKIQNIKKDKEFINNIDSLKIDNNDLKKELNLLQKDNAKLSHQLSETALKLNKNVIGNGDLKISMYPIVNNEFYIKFNNDNELAFLNGQIKIENYNELIKCEILKETENRVYIKSDCYKANRVQYKDINLNPYDGFLANTKAYPVTTDYMNFLITFSTRKNTMVYYVVFKIIERKPVLSYRAYNLINQNEIFVKEINPLKLTKEFWSKNFYSKDVLIDEYNGKS
jgi:hypothetical protein